MEIHERAMKHVSEIGEERKRSSLKRRLMMKLRKDGYDASLCRSSWVATTAHPGGNVTIIERDLRLIMLRCLPNCNGDR